MASPRRHRVALLRAREALQRKCLRRRAAPKGVETGPIIGPYLRHIRNLKPVCKLNTGGGAAKYGEIFASPPLLFYTPRSTWRGATNQSPPAGVKTHGLGERVPIYATYEMCGSVYKLHTGGAAVKGRGDMD